jgi:RNA polymerase subunit RPABC4/transcription elongation factor Spt4
VKSKLTKILLVVFISIGAAAILLIGTVRLIVYEEDKSFSAKLGELDSRFNVIGTAYMAFGSGFETQKAVDDFLNDIPESLRANNNIVIADKSGTIHYKTNNKYIHTESTELTMAWDSYAVIFDQATGAKHWIQSRGESIAEIDSGYIRTIGTDKIPQSQEELRSMISSYSNINVTESEVDITYIGEQKNPMYMFWFRDTGMGDAINKSFGQNENRYRLFTYFYYAGLLLLVLYWLLAPVWVFLDAHRRQTQPLPWALLVLLTNVVGLIVYWIVQSQNAKASPTLACPACGKPVQKNHQYCPWCAAPLMKNCKGCGKALEEEWVACPWCGKVVD